MEMRYGRDREETGSHQILYASLLLQLFLVSLLPCHMSILYCPQQLHLDVKALGERLYSMAPYNITARGQWNNYPTLPTHRIDVTTTGPNGILPSQKAAPYILNPLDSLEGTTSSSLEPFPSVSSPASEESEKPDCSSILHRLFLLVSLPSGQGIGTSTLPQLRCLSILVNKTCPIDPASRIPSIQSPQSMSEQCFSLRREDFDPFRISYPVHLQSLTRLLGRGRKTDASLSLSPRPPNPKSKVLFTGGGTGVGKKQPDIAGARCSFLRGPVLREQKHKRSLLKIEATVSGYCCSSHPQALDIPFKGDLTLWFLTDRRIREDYPQQQILRALKAKCCEEDLDFRALVMDEVVLTIEQGNLGLRVNGELITAYPQVVVVRVPTPWVQSDSDITVLRHLEKMGCRLMNRPQAILNCVNKFWTFQELAGHGVPLPDTFSYGGHENFAKMIDEAEVLEFPMVVKNTRGHRGKAVFLARDKHHLADLSHLIRHEAPYLFQKYVQESHGKDVRVIVVGGRVVGTMLRCSTDGRMQSNCSLGGIGMMCSLSEQGKQLAIQVSNILGMDVCGIDLLMKDDGSFYVCEANANEPKNKRSSLVASSTDLLAE
ncbi:beta-citrylglutamate synthase B isoform X2 [Podarcis lilfordi]|uniref:N-acetylaspartylglutamate synthase n=1 Tax=Podarcis lilfordi TaxID=74358 RepID=A0AA35LHP7_9SAUR|nr:beta-citrylglutamate synthase B isoform X2 [Podarcis lilfordi]